MVLAGDLAVFVLADLAEVERFGAAVLFDFDLLAELLLARGVELPDLARVVFLDPDDEADRLVFLVILRLSN